MLCADMTATATFDALKAAHDWQPIESCPGRYRLAGEDASRTPADLAGPGAYVAEHNVEGVRDKVLVIVLDGGGLISYVRADGSFVHTLNTAQGFDRKLRQLKLRRDLDDYF